MFSASKTISRGLAVSASQSARARVFAGAKQEPSGSAAGAGAPVVSKAEQDKRALASGKQTVGYVLHGKFTNNNTVLTLSRQYCLVGDKAKDMTWQQRLIDTVRPQQEVVKTITSGQLGFRNTKKSSYEAAFQTSAAMMRLIDQQRLLNGTRLEIVFRNFGEGREAFLNVLNGKEGTRVRDKVYRVTDGTKLKFGGDRAPVRRRV